MKHFTKKDWYDFNTLPGEDDLDNPLDLPLPDEKIFLYLKQLSEENEPEKITEFICKVSLLILDRIDFGQYTLPQAESVFRFVYQIARYNGFYIEEYSKRNDIFHTTFQICSDISSYLEDENHFLKTGEVRLLLLAVLNPEGMIQRLSAGYYDYRPQFIFLAKMFRDARLKSYLLKALRFYETVPEEELIEDRNLYIDNILEALGNPGWDEFAAILDKYLHGRDEIIPFTAMDSLGMIGGDTALFVLKRYHREVLEGFIDLDDYELISLELNIIAAESGVAGLIEEVKKSGNSLIRAQIAMRFLSSYRDPEIVSFVHSLLDDRRFQEAEVHYITEDEDFIQKEIHFPLREEAIMILQSYDESYVVSIVGNGFLSKRESFFNNLMKLYHLKSMESYWDNEDYLN